MPETALPLVRLERISKAFNPRTVSETELFRAGSVRSDTWWAAVSGVIPGEQPCPGCCRRAAVPLGAALTAASRNGPGSSSH